MPNLKLTDLKWGTLNNIRENDSNASGDRRRTSTNTAIRFATEKAFEKDTLAGISEFNGIVVHARITTFSSYQNRSSLLKQFILPSTASAETQDYISYAYKVYIPEMECRPVPSSYNDPVLITYPDIYSDLETSVPLPPGTLVVVKYEDPGNLFNPRIVRVTGEPVAITGITVDEAGKKIFENGVPSTLGSNAKNNYPPVKERVKTRYEPDYSSFAKRVSSLGSKNSFSEPAILSVISIAIKEQPRGGFNYNHWGVMADVGKGWGSTGRKYIDGSWPSTEGEGGEGVRTSKTRYFASFETEENGILFMLTKLSERGFEKSTSGSFAEMYYRKWLFSGSGGDESRIQELLKQSKTLLTSYYTNAKKLIDNS